MDEGHLSVWEMMSLYPERPLEISEVLALYVLFEVLRLLPAFHFSCLWLISAWSISHHSPTMFLTPK